MSKKAGYNKLNGHTPGRIVRDEKLEFKPAENGLVEFDGLVMPADMSDELKNLNVYIDQTTFEVNFLFYYLNFWHLIFKKIKFQYF